MSEVAEKEVVKNVIEAENRIDENGVDAFKAMGYTTRLSKNAVMAYREFKAKKDKIQPGRLTPEGYAFVAVIADMFDGKIKPVDEE